MSEAPERIWATPYDDFLDGGTFCDARDRPTAPNHDAWCYIRADLVEAAVRRAEAAEAALKTARDNALEEAGRKVDAMVQEFRINASACRETHPDFADDRDEHADDLEALAAAIRAIADDTDAIAKIIKGET